MSLITSNSVIEELSKSWKNCGINEGDTLLLHSDVRQLLMFYNYFSQPSNKKKKVILSVDNILDSFFNAVGTEGTLIIPLFNFDFTNGIPFNLNTTISQMGVLTEVARKNTNYVRTKNPVYSFAIFGKNKDYFNSIKLETAIGKNSVFSKLMELDGKIGVLGLSDKNCMTFYHHIEEMHQVSYRISKKFTGKYIDIDGNASIKTIYLYVRDLDNGFNSLLDPVGELMWEKGLYSGEHHNIGKGFRVISARLMYKFVSEIINKNEAQGMLYTNKL